MLALYGHPFSSYTWKALIPLALLNMLVTGFVILLKQNGWHF